MATLYPSPLSLAQYHHTLNALQFCLEKPITRQQRDIQLAFSLSAETTNKEVHECQLGAEATSLFAEEKLDRTSSIIPQR